MLFLLICAAAAVHARSDGSSAREFATPRQRIAGAIQESARIELQGNVHPFALPQFDRGAVSGALPMERMILLLKRSPEQQHALGEFLASVGDRNSPNFHRWLSPEEFGANFGVAPQDIDSIGSWLRSHGLTVDQVSRSHGAIEFSGNAAQVQEAFRTEIHRYVIKGESHYANANNPQIPRALTPVVSGVVALHNFYSRPSAHLAGRGNSSHNPQGKTQPALTFYGGGTTPLHVLVADDLQTIYNAKPLITATPAIDGTGQSVALLARSNILAADFEQYRALFQPFARMDALQVVINGADPGLTYGDDQVESTADVEYAGAMAPNAKLLLVVSDSTFSTDGIALSALYAVENNLAPVISLSYNACEAELSTAGNQFYSALWEQAAAEGITVVVSTGDSGAAACDSPASSGDVNSPAAATQGLAVNGLASTAYSLAVGGTQLSDNPSPAYWANQNNAAFGSALSYIPEIAWNESCSPADCSAQANLYAGGGGASNCTSLTLDGSNKPSCSGHYAKPAWQSAPGVIADGARDIPDVSLSAAQHDGYVLCLFESCSVNFNSGDFYFYVVGGTSLSTPEFAGVMTLVDQQTGTAQGQAAPTLYALASAQSGLLSQCNASNPGTSFSSCVFADITQGSNRVPCAGGSPGCSAAQAGSYGTLAVYNAGAGYDAVSGLGSVNVANLVNHWANGTRAATATLLTASPSVITHGQAVNLGIAVSAQSSGAAPGGDVAILTSSPTLTTQSIGDATLNNGSFSGPVTSLPGGSYQLTARYAGDANFAPSLSPGVLVTVQPEASTITLEPKLVLGSKTVTTLGQVPFGSAVTLDLQVAGVSGKGVPTGNVTLVAAPATGSPATQSFVLNNLGLAEWAGVESTLGNFSYSASYSGDASFQPTASQTLAFQVVPASTTVAVKPSASSLASTAQLQLTVNIQTASYASLTPTGTVTLVTGNSVLARTLVYGSTDYSTGYGAAQAEFTLPASTLTAGANSFTVTYSGDSNYLNATSSPVTVTVLPATPPGAPTSVDLSVRTIGGGATTAGQPVTLQAIVSHNNKAVTGGTVTFFNGSSPLGTVQVVGLHPAAAFTTGTATLSLRLPIASNLITARYNGQGTTYQPALSAPEAVNVTGSIPTTAVLTATANAENAANYDLTLSVAANSPAPPQGTSLFQSNTLNSTLGQATLQPATPSLAGIQQISIDGLSTADGIAVLAADLNGDGIPEAVTVNGTANSVSVLLGNGDGTFKSATQYAVDPSPSQALIVDLNQDGIPDIVTVNSGGTVSVLLGNGDGSFQAKRTFPVAGSPIAIVAADFNSDGIPDLAVASASSGYVSVLLGIGDGSFQPALNVFSSESASGLAAADFDKDGNPDLLVAGANGLFLLIGYGNGSFHLSSTQPTTLPVLTPVVADFNSDGAPDIAVPLASDLAEILLLNGNGDGTFQPAQLYSPGGFTSSTINNVALAAADLDGSGTMQLVQMLAGSGGLNANQTLFVYPNNKDGTFNPPFAMTVPAWSTNPPNAFAMADLNGDGMLDLLATTTGASSAALTSALMRSVAAATLGSQSMGATPQTIQASYTPSPGAADLPGISNTLTLGELTPSSITITPGYQTVLGDGSTCTFPANPILYYGYYPCFWLKVAPALSHPPTGTLSLRGINPQGAIIQSGPWQLLPNTNGVIVNWNSSLGDAGAYSLTASYGGDSVYQGSTSAALPLPLSTVQLTLNLDAPSVLLAGDSAVLSLSSTGSGWNGLYYVNDAVSWYDGETLLGSQFHGNSSTFTTPPLPVGTHVFTARYAGRTGVYGTLDLSSAVSPSTTTVVLPNNPSSSSIVLNISPSSPAFGQPVTMTATVTGANGVPQPAGTVTFLDGKTTLATVPLPGSSPAADCAPGTAVLRIPLAVGAHTLSVRYNGSAMLGSGAQSPSAQINAAQLSAPRKITVTPAAGSSIQLAAAVNSANSHAYDLTGALFVRGFVQPGGTLTFADTTANATVGSFVTDGTSLTPAFSAPLSIPLTGTASLVSAADFNGDGITDLAVADAVNNTVHVLLGTGNGGFAAQADYSLGSDLPASMLIADINNDGHLDIVIATTSNKIDVLLGNQNGTFQPAISVQLPIVPASIALGDLNGDGNLDLVVAGESGTTTLVTLLGNGDGSFQTPVSYSTDMLYSNASIVLADVNNDGALDVILQTNGYEVEEWLGVGDGTLQTRTDVTGVFGPIAAADLTGQGISDLLFSPSPGLAAVQLGRNDGSFVPPRYYPAGAPPNSTPGGPLAIVDLNGDGIPDIIVPGTIFLGVGDGTFQQNTISYSGGFTVLADINGDGVPDLVDISSGMLTVQYGGSQLNAILTAVALSGPGAHNIQVSYTPGQNVPYLGSTSNTVQLQANPTNATALSIIQSAPASLPVYGQPIAVQVTVTPYSSAQPTGQVAFTLDGVTGSPINLSVGSASTVLNGLSGGTHSISASYLGDSSYPPNSTCAPLSLTVGRAPDTLLLVSSPLGTVALNQSITFTASVQQSAGGAPPSGSITFSDGSTLLSTLSVSNGGSASYTTSSLGAGTHAITAAYVGDTNFVPSNGSLSLTVIGALGAAPTYTLSASAATATIAAGNSAGITLNLTSKGYAGTVSFSIISSLPSLVNGSAPSLTLTSGGSSSSTLTISATTNSAKHTAPRWKNGGDLIFCAVLLSAPFSFRRKRPTAVLMTALAISLAGLFMACGGGAATSSSTPPAAQSYTLTVTPIGTGTVTNPAPVTITVTVP